MKQIERILSTIENNINNSTFEKLETDRVEIKDNSHVAGKWTEIYKTTCAFLNTQGGIIIVGIYEDEKNKRFVVKGFDLNNEEKTKDLGKNFTDEHNKIIDVSNYISFEIHPFFDKNILAIYVEKLPEENKFIYYNTTAWERIITGDHKIDPQKIIDQKEYKLQLESAKELQPVINTTLNDLEVSKLNDYIHLLNRDSRIENIKNSIEDAASFLERKGFITKTLVPTLLGMLVCGKHVEDILECRSQVDGYVDIPGSADIVSKIKKSMKDNILPLMERSIAFTLQNISVGVSIELGGSSLPEYPERLLRESINNSLAHRDYGINRFININIVPNKHLEIRNPGKFKARLIIEDIQHNIPIRRIIPGDSKPNNPKLAEVLKIHDKWEGRGLGMSTLTNECLNNKIDLPYYKFHSDDELSLFINKGKLLDDKMESLIERYSGYLEKKLNGIPLTTEQKLVITYFYKSEIENKNDRYTILLTKNNNHLEAINSLEDSGIIVKHDISNALHPVYIIDRALFKKDFTNELRSLYGADFDALSKDAREALTIIYECNLYAKERFPNASKIGNLMWTKNENTNTIKGFEAFKRGVRNIVNQLEARKIISKVDNKPTYTFNKDFVRRPSLYD